MIVSNIISNSRIQSLNICATDDGKSDTIDLLVVVTSQVKNIEIEWLSAEHGCLLPKTTTSNIRYIFLLGHIDDSRSIEDMAMENIVHKDIVIGNSRITMRN